MDVPVDVAWGECRYEVTPVGRAHRCSGHRIPGNVGRRETKEGCRLHRSSRQPLVGRVRWVGAEIPHVAPGLPAFAGTTADLWLEGRSCKAAAVSLPLRPGRCAPRRARSSSRRARSGSPRKCVCAASAEARTAIACAQSGLAHSSTAIVPCAPMVRILAAGTPRIGVRCTVSAPKPGTGCVRCSWTITPRAASLAPRCSRRQHAQQRGTGKRCRPLQDVSADSHVRLRCVSSKLSWTPAWPFGPHSGAGGASTPWRGVRAVRNEPLKPWRRRTVRVVESRDSRVRTCRR